MDYEKQGKTMLTTTNKIQLNVLVFIYENQNEKPKQKPQTRSVFNVNNNKKCCLSPKSAF